MITSEDVEFLNGEELVAELKQEKQRLIKAGVVPDKVSKLKSTVTIENYELPENWAWSLLGDVSRIQEGPGIRKHQYSDDGIQFLTVTNIIDGYLDLEKSKKYISQKEYEEKYSHFTIDNGDIVTACSGATWGKSAFFNADRRMMLNTSTLRLRFFGDLADNTFLYYYTKSDFFKNSLRQHSTGQQANFGFSHYSIIPIPIPPLPEQERIVAKLDAAFAAIDQAKTNVAQNLHNAKKLFQSKLNEVFSASTSSATERGDGWVEKKLKEITSKIGSGATPRGGQKAYKTEGISLIRSLNVYDDGFREKALAFIDDEQASKLDNVTLQENDVLLNITGASVARCCVVPKDYLPARVNQHVSIIRANEGTIEPRFLHYQLISKPCKDELLGIGEQGSTRQAITKAQIENYAVVYPLNASEQLKIVDEIDKFKSITEQLQTHYTQKLAELEELKKSLLERAFKGEI